MKKRNKGKKALTAVGAVVAAGLTPGFIAASAAGSSFQGSNSGTTAADVVAIDGTAYGFDELYAKQHPDSVKMDTIEINIVLEPTEATLYGVPNVIAYGTTKYGVPITGGRITSVYEDYKVNEGETIFRSVEQMPKFPGGEAALKKYIDNHIKYPTNAAKNNIQGRVIVQFVVNKDGSVGEVKVVRSVDKDLDKEAVRVIKSLPKFTPGRQNGKAVSVWYTLPVTFKLPQKNKNW